MENPANFEHELSGLMASEGERSQSTAFMHLHLEGLASSANLHGVELDNPTRFFLSQVANDLRAHDMADTTEEKRDVERNLLADFAARDVPEHLKKVVLDYFPMEPLTEEDTGLIAEKIAEHEITGQRWRAILDEVDGTLETVEESSAELIELTENDEAFLGVLSRACYELRHNTPEADVEVRRANLLEMFNAVITKRDLNPALRKVVANTIRS